KKRDSNERVKPGRPLERERERKIQKNYFKENKYIDLKCSIFILNSSRFHWIYLPSFGYY
ncbi:MAG: hypothetical protein ACRDCF_01300, partial [Mycoplasmoidaceae bacterium]